jgi:hypothetical protein
LAIATSCSWRQQLNVLAAAPVHTFKKNGLVVTATYAMPRPIIKSMKQLNQLNI